MAISRFEASSLSVVRDCPYLEGRSTLYIDAKIKGRHFFHYVEVVNFFGVLTLVKGY